MTLLRRTATAVLALLFASAAGVGQDTAMPLAEADGAWSFEALGLAVTLPFPAWLTPDEQAGGNVLDKVESRHFGSDRQSLVEIVPQGETFSAWSTLYAARITRGERTLAEYRRATMFGYASTCKPEATGFFQLGEDAGENLAPLGFVCGSFLDRLAGYEGQGEVMIMAFKQVETGIAVVYQEWRGPAFDPADPASWPIATDIVESQAQVLQQDATLIAAAD